MAARGRRRQQQEESVYNWGQLQPPAAASSTSRSTQGPQIKTYNVGAPPAAPPRRMHEDSSQVESILKPVRGIRDAQRRAGITPTNHARLNIQAVKEQSRLNALQQQQQQHDVAASRRDVGGGGRRGGSQRPSLQGECQARRSSSDSGGGARRRPLGDGCTAAAAAAAAQDGGGGGGTLLQRNFVEENKAAAAAAAARRPVKAEARAAPAAGGFLQKREYGQVPAYLLERKMQLAEEAEALLAAKAAAAIPPGLRRMPEAERVATLALLAQNRAEVEGRLQGLPIIIETHSMRRHKEDLERRLAEIEEARRIFARPHVLVQADGSSSGVGGVGHSHARGA